LEFESRAKPVMMSVGMLLRSAASQDNLFRCLLSLLKLDIVTSLILESLIITIASFTYGPTTCTFVDDCLVRLAATVRPMRARFLMSSTIFRSPDAAQVRLVWLSLIREACVNRLIITRI